MPIAYLTIMKGKENLVQKEKFWEARVKLQQWFETVCKEIDEIIKSVEARRIRKKMRATGRMLRHIKKMVISLQ